MPRSPSKAAQGYIYPQLATLRDQPPNGDAWIHEIKFDGYRLQLAQGDKTRLLTRNGIDWTKRFPTLIQTAKQLPRCIIDGELTALEPDGTPSFSALQSAVASGQTHSLVYYAFDLLADDSDDIRKLPLLERKRRLAGILKPLGPHSAIRFVDHLTGDSKTIFRHVCELGLEGLVSKRSDGRYVSGRTQSWVKVKCFREHEVLIGGWIERHGTLATLLIGEQTGTGLHYTGRLGAALPQRRAREVLARLRELELSESPFKDHRTKRSATARWAEPKLKAVISYLTRTKSGSLRHHTIKEIVDVAAAERPGQRKP